MPVCKECNAELEEKAPTDSYRADILAVATLMRAHKPLMAREQWQAWLRVLAARGDDLWLPFDLVRQ